jgi:predicted regulator of Ras-like GTPase activity (Roadblock/LC7/MglB family)
MRYQGGYFITVAGQLREELVRLSREHDVEISALISRSGIPIAWHLPDESSLETFATLSATILGASEVVYSGLGKAVPNRVTIESETGGTFVASGIDKKTIIVAMSTSVGYADLTEAVKGAEGRIREVLSNGHSEL